MTILTRFRTLTGSRSKGHCERRSDFSWKLTDEDDDEALALWLRSDSDVDSDFETEDSRDSDPEVTVDDPDEEPLPLADPLPEPENFLGAGRTAATVGVPSRRLSTDCESGVRCTRTAFGRKTTFVSGTALDEVDADKAEGRSGTAAADVAVVPTGSVSCFFAGGGDSEWSGSEGGVLRSFTILFTRLLAVVRETFSSCSSFFLIVCFSSEFIRVTDVLQKQADQNVKANTFCRSAA